MTGQSAPVAFTLTVTMLSDWHVGTGAGRHGAIDRLIERDVDELPFIPATTLRGIWRDAAERLALGLDGGTETGGWSRLVEAVFGEQATPAGERSIDRAPRPGALRLAAGRLPEPLREALAGEHAADARLRQALTFVKPGVAIDPQTGRARQDHLRFEEVARQGAILTAHGTLDLPADDGSRGKAMLAVLVGATALVERLGGKRRRGTGRSVWAIDVPDPAGLAVTSVQQAVAVLHEMTDAPPTGAAAAGPAVKHGDPDSGGAWETVSLDLTLKSPLVIADHVLGNVVTSLDFIPGTFLLAHVADCLSGPGVDVRAELAAGNIRVSPALPVVSGRRGLPIPLSWSREKDSKGGPDGKGTLWNLAAKVPRDDRQHKPVRRGYVAPPGGGGAPDLCASVGKLVRTHNTIEDAVQRPTQAVGGVYAYEAIRPGTTFRTVVRVRQPIADRLSGDWRGRLAAGTVRLGRAAKAGYGEAALAPTGEPAATVPTANAARFAVLFNSDTLLRTPLLGCASTQLQAVEAISEAVGRQLKVRALEDREPAGLRIRRIESWAAAWHLPRPSLIAIQAGSFLLLETEDGSDIPADRLVSLQAEGLGERRAEGYGELLVNPDLLAVETSAWTPPATRAHQPLRGSTAALKAATGLHGFVRQIEEAAWRTAIEEAAFTFAADHDCRRAGLGWTTESDQGRPPMSQLGALRSAMGGWAGDEDVAATRVWVAQVGRNDSRSGKWGEALGLLETLLTDPDCVWRLLFPDGQDGALPAELVTDPADLKERFWSEAVRALLLAAIRGHKRDLERGRADPDDEEAVA